MKITEKDEKMTPKLPRQIAQHLKHHNITWHDFAILVVL